MAEQSKLVRDIGRWSLAALVLNSIIGSGVFKLPSDVARLVGRQSPWADLLASAVVGVLIACIAEVASRFSAAGGPYLYARATFGRLTGLETGWMLVLARLTAPAANANLFIIYLGEFWPRAKDPIPKVIILTGLVGVLALANFRGVRSGKQISDIFTAAKLIPLFLVAGVGVVYLLAGHAAPPPAQAEPELRQWLKAVLLLVFAYGGFENALTPMSEAKDPQRDVAFSLFVALLTCTLLYTAIQWTVVGLLPDPVHSERPLADVARLIAGPKGAILVAIAALVSVYGYLSANLLAVPRILFALAENRDLPAFFGKVHARFHTPYVSILTFAFLVWLLAVLGSFAWNVTLSAVARLFYYGICCAALPVLRKKEPGGAQFRLPGGPALAMVGVAICVVLVTQVDLSGSLILLATAIAAFVNWLLVKNATVPA
ncbi:MAG: amino acid permease [Acidobacteria bacterium]|nr:amino acid permease [Acidobacteriota bacterium]